MLSEQQISEGQMLRKEILAWKNKTKISLRELSRRAGADPNYLHCFMGRDPKKWALPKEPTLGNIRREIAKAPKAPK